MANDLTREVDDLRVPLRLRAKTANDEALTVECVIATERAVPTIDRERWEMVDEVLVAGGCREVDSVVMLDSHRRDSVKRIYGSLRNVRVNGTEVESTLVFDDSPDPREAYGKAKRGHLRDVSAGYRVLAYTDIRAGETSTISGREYTAGARTLRVATDWELREGSLVPIGADRDAKIRSIYEDGASARASNQEELAMKPKDQVDQPGGEAPREEGARAERERILEITKRGRAASIAHETIAAAIEAGESPDAASARFLAALSATRSPAVGASSDEAEVSAPDIHIRSGASNVPPKQRLRDLGFGLRHAIGAPVKPIAEVVTDYERRHRDATLRARSEGVAPPEARVFGISDAARGVPGAERLSAADYARSAEEGYRFRDLSLLDYLRESVEIATGRRAPRGGQAVINAYADLCQGGGIRAAGVSVSDLQNVFTDSVAAQLIAAYELAGDTTEFVRVTDIADFRSQPRPRPTPLNPMGLLPDSGAQPADMNALGDTTESYRAARFADQFALDERAFIDDRLDLFSTIPRAMGQNAGQVRPDGVYFTLLNGATAGLAGPAPIFSSGNGNYVASSGALGSTTLQTALAAMETQVEASANGSNRILNIVPKYLVTGKATRWTGLELMNSTMIVASGGTSQAVRGSTNVLANALQVVSDARFDKGVRDPFSKTPSTASADPDGWAVVADQRYPTIEVGYVRATGRAPVIRPYMLVRGQWGMGWDIKLDLGVKALDYRGLYYSKGA